MTDPIDLEAIKQEHTNEDRRYPDITGWASPDAHVHRGQLLAEVERLREDNRRLMAKSGEPEGYWAIWRIAGELSAENERLRARVAELARDAGRYQTLVVGMFSGKRDEFIVMQNDPETGASYPLSGDELSAALDSMSEGEK